MCPILISIVGPTSVGKTFLSLFLAKKLSCEIISCDSRQFYKELKIGTSTPKKEDLKKIKHHFIGHLNIYQSNYYTVKNFEKDVLKKLNHLFNKNLIVIMVGGSCLYEKVITQGLDNFPEVPIKIYKDLRKIFQEKGILYLQKKLKNFDPFYYQEVDINNPHRIIRALGVIYISGKPFSYFRTGLKVSRPFHIIKIGLFLPRKELYLRINKRVDQMICDGLIQEAKIYYPYKNLNALKTIGYKELFLYFKGFNTLKDTIEEIKKNTRHYAKRQLSWYLKDKKINWFSPNQKIEILNFITNFIKNNNS